MGQLINKKNLSYKKYSTLRWLKKEEIYLHRNFGVENIFFNNFDKPKYNKIYILYMFNFLNIITKFEFEPNAYGGKIQKLL